jgi:UDP-N-acetylmuramyl pentapeptide phosphotransferase/UDP-N-acetylglucosamine-1-phosphate transferase
VHVRGEEGTMQDAPQAGIQPQYHEAVKPQRGGVILALGIIGIVLCFITAIIAWVMGSGDIKEMKEGKRDPSGEQLTKAGMICGIIGVCLGILGILWCIIAVVFMGAMGSLQ